MNKFQGKQHPIKKGDCKSEYGGNEFANITTKRKETSNQT
jgi:hypothetical protein